ncbi:MAG: formimidoylglutamate deiminase [Actinomycetota bacterium]|nr:formimidoylglutamate deiminase [Actinomycetota bacterium]
MVAYWCEMAWLGGPTATPGVLVKVNNDVIESVQTVAQCPAGAVRLAGLTLPGLANAHSHAFHRALRGRTHSGSGSFWTWRDQMYSLARTLNPDSYHRLARAVYGEMALAGVTCVGEFHYLHHGPGGVPYANPNAMSEALVVAATDVGIRITLLDTCYLYGGFGVSPNDVQQRFSDGTAAAWAQRVEAIAQSLTAPGVLLGAAIHSVRAVDVFGIRTVAEWAGHHRAPVHSHVSEQQSENDQCIDTYGLTPTALLAEHGVLDAEFTAVHATHLAGVDVGMLGVARSTVCMCPTTERDLADGIGAASALAAAGASLSLGSDSHAVIDLFEEARAVELDERLSTGVRGNHRAVALLRAATADGHRSLGWGTAGVLAAGAHADLVSVRLDSVRTAGTTIAEALEAAVFAATAADVHHVVASGKVVVCEGRHAHLDVERELAVALAATRAG